MEWNEKQIQILEITEKLFAEKGFDGTSVRHIAKEAGINIAMISYYFGSKEKLLESLLLYRTADFRMEIESILEKNEGFMETIDTLLEMVVKRIHKNRRIYKIIHFEYSNENRKLDFDRYVAQKQENYQHILQFIQKGQEAGVFSTQVNTSMIMPTVLGTYFNFYYNKRFFMNINDLHEDASVDAFVAKVLIPHIQRTIKALLTYEV